jgi:hypothetical protein
MVKKSKKANQYKKFDEQVQEETTEKTIESEPIIADLKTEMLEELEHDIDSEIEKTVEELRLIPDVPEVVFAEEIPVVQPKECVCSDTSTEPCTCVEEKSAELLAPQIISVVPIEVPKLKRTVESLSPNQLKIYQRTGFLPK